MEWSWVERRGRRVRRVARKKCAEAEVRRSPAMGTLGWRVVRRCVSAESIGCGMGWVEEKVVLCGLSVLGIILGSGI
jgi:hypothetical protein